MKKRIIAAIFISLMGVVLCLPGCSSGSTSSQEATTGTFQELEEEDADFEVPADEGSDAIGN